jgi:hypothetical protein
LEGGKERLGLSGIAVLRCSLLGEVAEKSLTAELSISWKLVKKKGTRRRGERQRKKGTYASGRSPVSA